MDKPFVSVDNEQYIALLDKVQELSDALIKERSKKNHYKNKYYTMKRIVNKYEKDKDKNKQHYRNSRKKGRTRNG